MEKTQRMSFDMPSHEHQFMKMACVKMGLSMREFIIEAILNKLYDKENEWLLESIKLEEDDSDHNFVLIDHEGQFHAISS